MNIIVDEEGWTQLSYHVVSERDEGRLGMSCNPALDNPLHMGTLPHQMNGSNDNISERMIGLNKGFIQYRQSDWQIIEKAIFKHKVGDIVHLPVHINTQEQIMNIVINCELL